MVAAAPNLCYRARRIRSKLGAAMTPEDKAAVKALFPGHAFLRIVHPVGEAVIAIPREQATPEKEATVEMWHGGTVRLS